MTFKERIQKSTEGAAVKSGFTYLMVVDEKEEKVIDVIILKPDEPLEKAQMIFQLLEIMVKVGFNKAVYISAGKIRTEILSVSETLYGLGIETYLNGVSVTD